MKSEWFESFFTPLALDFWRAAVPSAATAEDVDFLVHHLGVTPPSRLLDVPSGLGRHAIPLAARGYWVAGIDIAPTAVTAARQEAQARGLSGVNFLVGDMRRPPPDGRFDGAYCFGNSFSYLEYELQAQIAAWFEKAKQADEEEDREFGRDRSGDELPDWVADKQKRIAKIREARLRLESEAKAQLAAGVKPEPSKPEDDGPDKPPRGRRKRPKANGEPHHKAQLNFTDLTQTAKSSRRS